MALRLQYICPGVGGDDALRVSRHDRWAHEQVEGHSKEKDRLPDPPSQTESCGPNSRAEEETNSKA